MRHVGSFVRARERAKPTRAILALGAILLLSGCLASTEDTGTPRASRPPVWTWPTWVLRSPRSVTVPPPPSAASAAPADRAVTRRRVAHARWSDDSPTEEWTELNLRLVSSTRTVDAPLVSRGYALVSVAMYDAVVASAYWSRQYGRPGYPSQAAAVAGAASRVLAYLFPQRPAAAFDRRAERVAHRGVAAGLSDPSDVEAGLALGRAVAERVIARARTDGSGRVWNGQAPRGDQFWSPAFAASDRPVEPLAGTWRTWVLKSAAEFRPSPPPRFGSTRFLAETRELLRLRTELTPEQKRIAKFWEGAAGTPLPPGVWNEVALAYVRRDRLSTADAAQVFALVNVAMADAGVAVWDTKYAYWSARPQTAIQELRLGRTWTPFLATPAFPSYVSAHSGFSGAASEVLAAIFPKDAAAFRRKAVEAGVSRLYGGIHFRSDHVAGLAMGRAIGRLVVERGGLTGIGDETH